MPTIKDVARAAGVSVSTVSIVLNGLAEARKIPPATREKVIAAVREVDYQPNLSARRLRTRAEQEYTVALYWGYDTRSFALTQIIQALHKKIMDLAPKIALQVRPFIPGRLNEDAALKAPSSFNGVIIGTLDQKDLDYLEENPPLIPVVLFNRRSRVFSSVSTDNNEAGALAAAQLLNKNITDIGAVTQGSTFVAMGLRRQSFLDACRAHGITSLEDSTLVADDTIAGGYAAGKEFLRRGHVPKGIFCEDDAMAYGLVSALTEAGLRVPEDVKVVATGLGSPDLSRHSVPPLTVVEIPLDQLAEASLPLLISLIERKSFPPQDIRFEYRLYARQSC